MKAVLISDNVDTSTGFNLAGIKSILVHEKEEIVKAIYEEIHNPDIEIIIITEVIGKKIPEIVSKEKLNKKSPLIIEIPDRHGSIKEKGYILKYIKEAIGLKI